MSLIISSCLVSIPQQMRSAAPLDFSYCVVSPGNQRYESLSWKACQELYYLFSDRPCLEPALSQLPLIFAELHIERRRENDEKATTLLTASYEPVLNELYNFSEEDPTLKWEIFSDMPGHFGICTRVVNGLRLGHYTYLVEGNFKEDPRSSIGHPSGLDFTAALNYCETLANAILRKITSDEIAQKQIHELHWWLVNTAPFAHIPSWRNAGISNINLFNGVCAETVIAAITLHRFGRLTPYRTNLSYSPEHLALVTKPEEFISMQSSLRE